MSMSKKDLIALAEAIRHANAINGESSRKFREDHLTVLANFCASQNPNFNRQRWLDYIAGEVGPSGGRVKS